MSSSPFTTYGHQPPRHHGGAAPAPGFYWYDAAAPYPYQAHTRQCETRGIGTPARVVLGFLVGGPLGWLVLCLLAVTGPVSVPVLFGVAIAVTIFQPRRGTGQTRPAPSGPQQRNTRPPTRPAWSPHSTRKN